VRLSTDEALEALLLRDADVRERFLRDVAQVLRALPEAAADLVRTVGDRTAHLPGKLFAELAGARDAGFGHAAADRHPLGDWHALPARLRGEGEVERRFDLGLGRKLALDEDRAVDRADSLLTRPVHPGDSTESAGQN
jgi:hypothetical protein